MNLRAKVTETMGKVPAERAYSDAYPYYYRDFRENLYCPMGEQAYRAYEEGRGGELEPYTRFGKLCPPKMASVASSSAMTFNLLGNDPATILPGGILPAGNYQVEYEKQMYTLSKGSMPAHLDAFLRDDSGRTAVFCEMKLLEWLGDPGPLKEAYRRSTYYFKQDPCAVPYPVDAYSVFQDLIEEIEQGSFKRYDAWQMFKHLLAIYNYTSFTTREAVERFRNIPSMTGKYHRIILTNIVNEYHPQRISDEKARAKYILALEEERAEAGRFIDIVQNSGIPCLFDNHCHGGIKILYLSAREFAYSLDMPQEKREYLRRYFA